MTILKPVEEWGDDDAYYRNPRPGPFSSSPARDAAVTNATSNTGDPMDLFGDYGFNDEEPGNTNQNSNDDDEWKHYVASAVEREQLKRQQQKQGQPSTNKDPQAGLVGCCLCCFCCLCILLPLIIAVPIVYTENNVPNIYTPYPTVSPTASPTMNILPTMAPTENTASMENITNFSAIANDTTTYNETETPGFVIIKGMVPIISPGMLPNGQDGCMTVDTTKSLAKYGGYLGGLYSYEMNIQECVEKGEDASSLELLQNATTRKSNDGNSLPLEQIFFYDPETKSIRNAAMTLLGDEESNNGNTAFYCMTHVRSADRSSHNAYMRPGCTGIGSNNQWEQLKVDGITALHSGVSGAEFCLTVDTRNDNNLVMDFCQNSNGNIFNSDATTASPLNLSIPEYFWEGLQERENSTSSLAPTVEEGDSTTTPAWPTLSPTTGTTALTTPAPTTDKTLQLMKDILNDVASSPDQILENPNSPQYQAALWLAAEDSSHWPQKYKIDPDEIAMTTEDWGLIRQPYALATLYFATNGDEWTFCGNNSGGCGNNVEWLKPAHECRWGFVDCSADQTVESVQFSFNNLNGTLPSELNLLTGLRKFGAIDSLIHGSIEAAFRELSALEWLNLANNQIEGNVPLNTNLEYMDLTNNNLSGEIPIGFIKLSGLRLGYNNLVGRIPSELRVNTLLQRMELQGNNLSGNIPSGFYELTSLEILSVENNPAITGTISPLIAQLSNLEVLQLGYTSMKGPLPNELFALTLLKELNLQGAGFSSTLPEQFHLLNSSLVDLFLNNNSFTGQIPEAFDKLTALETLRLERNQLTGSISQTICDERGLRFQQLAELIVDCTVTCGCCDNCVE